MFLPQHFTCAATGTKLTVRSAVVADGEVYLKGKEPKYVSQSADSVDAERHRKAKDLATDVGIVNVQVRGAEETVGKGASTADTRDMAHAAKASALATDVGMVNQQLRGAPETLGKGMSGAGPGM